MVFNCIEYSNYVLTSLLKELCYCYSIRYFQQCNLYQMCNYIFVCMRQWYCTRMPYYMTSSSTTFNCTRLTRHWATLYIGRMSVRRNVYRLLRLWFVPNRIQTPTFQSPSWWHSHFSAGLLQNSITLFAYTSLNEISNCRVCTGGVPVSTTITTCMFLHRRRAAGAKHLMKPEEDLKTVEEPSVTFIAEGNSFVFHYSII